jgi:hypothetical protein
MRILRRSGALAWMSGLNWGFGPRGGEFWCLQSAKATLTANPARGDGQQRSRETATPLHSVICCRVRTFRPRRQQAALHGWRTSHRRPSQSRVPSPDATPVPGPAPRLRALFAPFPRLRRGAAHCSADTHSGSQPQTWLPLSGLAQMRPRTAMLYSTSRHRRTALPITSRDTAPRTPFRRAIFTDASVIAFPPPAPHHTSSPPPHPASIPNQQTISPLLLLSGCDAPMPLPHTPSRCHDCCRTFHSTHCSKLSI